MTTKETGRPEATRKNSSASNSIPDVSFLLAQLMPRTLALLFAKGVTISTIAEVLPATAAALLGLLR